MSSPRGIRNNNPGNIRLGEEWQGMSANQSDPSFVQFSTPEAGVRAMAKLLGNYRTLYGLETIEGIVGRWAPPNENDTGKYVSDVAAWTGLDPKARLDLDDEATMLKLTRAIARKENGDVPWDDDTFLRGIRAAQGREDLPQANPQEFIAQTNAVREQARQDGQPLQWGDTQVIDPIERDKLEELRAEAEANTPGLWEGTKLAVGQEWGFLWAMNSGKYAPDPDFKMDDAFLKELTQDVPQEYWDWFEQAHSKEHAAYLKGVLMSDLAAQQKLASMGWEGTALRIGAAAIDPVALGIGIATDGLAAPFLAGMKASRIGHALAMGISAAGGNVAADSLFIDNKPTFSSLDLLYSAAGGFALGGTIGALSKGTYSLNDAEAMRGAGQNLMEAVEREAARREAATAAAPNGDAGMSNAGAMEVSYAEPLRRDILDILRDVDDTVAPHAAGYGRWDVVGQLKKDENPLARMGGALAEDGVGNANRDIATPYGVSEYQMRLQRTMETKFYQSYAGAYREWADSQGLGWWGRVTNRHTFNTQVSDFIENVDPTREFHPAVVRQGETVRKLLKDLKDLANNPGLPEGSVYRPVQGFGGVVDDPHYLPRIINSQKLREYRNSANGIGDKKLRKLITQSVRDALPELAPELAAKYARGWLKIQAKVQAGMEARTSGALRGDDLDALKEMFAETGSMSNEELDSIINLLKRKEDGAHTRAKQRLPMNHETGMWFTRNNGQREFVRVKDLFERDVEHLFHNYNRSLSGAISLARWRVPNPKEEGKLLVDGITNRSDFETYLQQVRAAGEELGIDGMKTDAAVKNLDFLYHRIMGIPMSDWETGKLAQWLRVLGDYNFIRVMNQVGFAQVVEAANVVGQVGFKAALSNMPALRTLWRDIKTGRVGDEIGQEIEEVFGLGSDWLRGMGGAQWDEFGRPNTIFNDDPFLNTANNALQKGKRATAAISMMAPINTFLHRWSARAIVGKFARIAADYAKTGKISQADARRLKTLGLSDKMMDRVLKQTKHFTVEEGFTGLKVNRMNLEKWDDLQARTAFEDAVDRWARRIIQENDIGTMAKWMSTPMGKMLLQFRTFMMGSWTKQFLHNIHMRDFTAFTTMAYTTLAGALVYGFHQGVLKPIGMNAADAQRHRDQVFGDPIRFMFNAWSRTGWSTLFPMLVSFGANTMNLPDPINGRTTGLPSDVILGNPTVNLLFDTPKRLIGGMQVGVANRPMSQQEVRDLNSVLPFANFLPWMWVLNSMIQDKPARAPKQ